MSDEKSILEFRIFDSNNPERFTPNQFGVEGALAIRTFLESFSEIAASSGDSSAFIFRIKNGSLKGVVEFEENSAGGQRIKNVLQGSSRRSDDLKWFKNLQELIQKNGVNYEFQIKNSHNQTTDLLPWFKNQTFRRSKSNKKKSSKVVFIRGEITEMGGAKPNFHVQTDYIRDKKQMVVFSEKQRITNLNRRVYENIYCAVNQRIHDGEETHHADFIDSYRTEEESRKFQEFYQTYNSLASYDRHIFLGRTLNNCLQNDEYKYNLQAYLHLTHASLKDFGDVHTVQMTLKPYSDSSYFQKNISEHPIIQKIYDWKPQN